MKRFFKNIAENPRELFDTYVYLVGMFITWVLAENKLIISAILQSVIWIGYVYKLHRDSMNADANAREMYKTQDSLETYKSLYAEAEQELAIAYSIMTEEQRTQALKEKFKKRFNEK